MKFNRITIDDIKGNEFSYKAISPKDFKQVDGGFANIKPIYFKAIKNICPVEVVSISLKHNDTTILKALLSHTMLLYDHGSLLVHKKTGKSPKTYPKFDAGAAFFEIEST